MPPRKRATGQRQAKKGAKRAKTTTFSSASSPPNLNTTTPPSQPLTNSDAGTSCPIILSVSTYATTGSTTSTIFSLPAISIPSNLGLTSGSVGTATRKVYSFQSQISTVLIQDFPWQVYQPRFHNPLLSVASQPQGSQSVHFHRN